MLDFALICTFWNALIKQKSGCFPLFIINNQLTHSLCKRKRTAFAVRSCNNLWLFYFFVLLPLPPPLGFPVVDGQPAPFGLLLGWPCPLPIVFCFNVIPTLWGFRVSLDWDWSIIVPFCLNSYIVFWKCTIISSKSATKIVVKSVLYKSLAVLLYEMPAFLYEVTECHISRNVAVVFGSVSVFLDVRDNDRSGILFGRKDLADSVRVARRNVKKIFYFLYIFRVLVL